MIRRSLTALALGFTLAAAPAALAKDKQPVAPAAAPLSSYVNPDPSVEPENILLDDFGG